MKKPGIQKVSYRKIFLIIFFGILFISPLGIFAENVANYESALINNKTINLEVADTPAERAMGLMYRDSLEDNHGMIFIFEKPEPVSFWMKNVKFPLDIVFIYKDKIVNIYNRAPGCSQEPCKIYPSNSKVDYVIELNGGFCEKNGINVGQQVKLNDNLKKYFTIN